MSECKVYPNINSDRPAYITIAGGFRFLAQLSKLNTRDKATNLAVAGDDCAFSGLQPTTRLRSGPCRVCNSRAECQAVGK